MLLEQPGFNRQDAKNAPGWRMLQFGRGIHNATGYRKPVLI